MRKGIFLAVLVLLFQPLFCQENIDFAELFSVPNFDIRTMAETGSENIRSLAAETGDDDTVKPTPQWLKDLRRAEIISFGTIPFTIFFSSFFMDLYRSGSHGWDSRYLPWPLKSAGAVSMTANEQRAMFAIAISSSLVLALTDHLIVRHKRARESRQSDLR
jgi:hypothetical protein